MRCRLAVDFSVRQSVGDREQDGNPRQPEHPAQETAHADDANEQPSLEQQLASAHDKISDLQEQGAAKDQRIADLEARDAAKDQDISDLKARMASFEQSMGTQSDAGVQHAQDAEKDTTDGADTDAEQTGGDDPGLGQADERLSAEGERESKKEAPRQERGLPKEMALGLATTTVGAAITAVGHFVPAVEFAATLGKDITELGFGAISAAGFTLFKRRKNDEN